MVRSRGGGGTGGGKRLGVPAGEGTRQLQPRFGQCPSAGPRTGHPERHRAGERVQGGVDEATVVCPGKWAWQRPPPREKLPACGWCGGGLAGVFLHVVCGAGTSWDGKAEPRGWGEAELGCAVVGVCADPHPGEGQKAGAGKGPGDARGLPQHLLRSRFWELGNGSWKCRGERAVRPCRGGGACRATEPAWEARAVPRASREHEPPMENTE